MSVIPIGNCKTASLVLWVAAVLPLIPLVHPVKFKLEIPVYEICSVPIVITPLVANPVTEATPIVATVEFIPADKVVLIPLDVPSDGER